jgi:hypothetical protein
MWRKKKDLSIGSNNDWRSCVVVVFVVVVVFSIFRSIILAINAIRSNQRADGVLAKREKERALLFLGISLSVDAKASASVG